MSEAVRILESSPDWSGARDGLVPLVSGNFGLPARRTSDRLDLERAYDSARRQYDATALLGQVTALAQACGERCIAVVDVDLFIPVLTFVFGQATLNGPAAIVSTYRLSNEFYGLKRDDVLLQSRLEKEVLHELGHVFGLFHCRQFECVMRSSTYVEEIDLKRAWFCSPCEALLRGRPQLGRAPA